MEPKVSSKYTRQILEPIVSTSLSVYDVLRALGLRFAGGNWSYIKRRLTELNIDTSHFVKNGVHSGGIPKLGWEEVLIYNRKQGRRESQNVLKRAMLVCGFIEICEICGLGPSWQDKKLSLQIDHKNGNFLDNRCDNIRFLCPNCHTQTETFGSNKPGVSRTRNRRENVCGCGKPISYSSVACVACHRLQKPPSTKIDWPDNDALKQLVWSTPTTTLAKQLGVSTATIAKRCKRLSIVTPGIGYWSKHRGCG